MEKKKGMLGGFRNSLPRPKVKTAGRIPKHASFSSPSIGLRGAQVQQPPAVRKGVMYTLVTFLIFTAMIAYINILFDQNMSLSGNVDSSISSQRVYHYWNSVNDNMDNIANVSMAKKDSTFAINDSLPAANSVNSLLGRYGLFVDQFFRDGTIDIHFEDDAGNRIALDTISPKITLSPMNITYGWNSWGKNELQIMSPVSSLGFISTINLTINFVNQTIANNSITWSPYMNCRAGQPCLLLYLYVSDGAKTITSAQTAFDLSRNSKSDQVYCAGANCWLRVRTGPWGGGDPQNVLKIELQNLNITTNTKILLNTSSFYASFPTKLFVGTNFARKLYYAD